jgi:hypothetical protein
MASHNIFIGGQEVYDKPLGINSSYTYADGSLRIYNKGRVVYFLEAKEGDAFVVICDKGKAFLKKMVPPQRKGALIAWLLRFNKDNRASSVGEYKRKLPVERQRHYWENYQEQEYKSDGYIFTLCNSRIDNYTRNVAGFFSDAITKKEILGLVNRMNHHPEWYIKKILKERFGISEEEFEEARAKH